MLNATTVSIVVSESLTALQVFNLGLDFRRASLIAQLVKNPPAMQAIPGSRGSPGEGIGYPLQYSGFRCGSAGKKKNPPAMQETCVQSLVWENPLEKGNAIHFSILT